MGPNGTTSGVHPPPLEAEGLSRDFGPIHAVEDLSFRVEEGEIVGLLGPNGAGKSTALRMLTGSLIPTRGRVRLRGHDILTEGPEARAHLGYLPEQLALYGEMTVSEYLAFVASVKGIEGGGEGAALGDARTRLGLGAVWDRPTRAISRGYRQRVGLAQAILGDPELLVLDEPTAGLDPNQAREFRQQMRALGSRHSILLSTHILPEAMEVCDRVIIMNKGRRVAMDRPDRLIRDPASADAVVARIRLDRRPDVGDPNARIVDVDGAGTWRVEGTWDARAATQVLRRLVDQGAGVIEWRSGAGGLEEVFRRLTLEGEGS